MGGFSSGNASYLARNSASLKERSNMKIPEANQGGDCFESALNHMIKECRFNKDSTITLVHGEVTGQGPIAGIKYGHAWVEDGDLVIDKSRGRNIQMPKAIYYALGNIERTMRYTFEEMRKKILDHGTYGPWDLETEY